MTIADALESAISQKIEGIEHLVVDGLSSDETLDIVRQYPGIRLISEPDKGIYDAMNKGASMALGEWILFLQADDWLPEGTILAYCEAIRRNPTASILCGDAMAVKEVGGVWTPVWSVTDSEEKKLTVKNIALGEPMINARLIRRDIFRRLGGFSPEYSLASDRDFLLNAVQDGLEQCEIAEMTYRYRWHPGSSTMTEGNALTDRLLDENLAVAKRHLLISKGVDKDALIRWHTRLTLQGAMNALEKGGHRLAGFLASGFSKDPFWPVVFFREILKSMPGFLARGGRTRSQLRADPVTK